MKIEISEIRKLLNSILLKHGLNKEDANIISDECIDAELRGRKCHGLTMFKKFIIEAIKGRQGDAKIIKDKPCYTLIDGRGNMGTPICFRETEKAIKKAKKMGICMIGFYNMESYLMPGTFARMVAEKDMIALLCNYGGRARIAPTGSIDPIFGTNPIACGIPSNKFPIVLDMATSKEAMGEIRLAQKLGKKLLPGLAIDKNGNPTTDPSQAMDGALLPFGDYKGSGLALVVEILSRCLFNIRRDYKLVKRGYFFIIIDPTKFIDIKTFKRNVDELIDEIKNSRKAKGVKEIFLPGERSERIKQENLKKGYIEVEDEIIKEVKSL